MKQFSKLFFAVALLCSPALSFADCDAVCAQTNSCMNCTEICVSNCDGCVSCNNCSTSPCGCATIFIPRPAFDNTALLRTLPFERHVCGDENYGGWGLDVEYQRSFNSSKLAQCLFGSQPLVFQGSDVAGRADTSLRAENFGLPTVFEGSVAFKPRIQNVNMHLVGFMGLSEWAHGLWGRVELTFQHQTRELRGCENSLASTTTQEFYPAGLFDANAKRAIGSQLVLVPHQSIATALQGNVTWGEIIEPWHYGKFDWCKQHKNGIAGFAGELGYDFVLRENGHLGGFFRFVAPTGNRPDMTTVFSPVVGNGHHWEVGGGVTAHWNFWTCEESSLGLYLDGYATAALSDRQARTFDLCYTDTLNGCYSRYSLLKAFEFRSGIDNDTSAFEVEYQSTGRLLNGVNYLTRLADVKIPVKGDATLRMLYTSSDWNVGFGFNVYGQAREKVCNVSSVPVIANAATLSGLAVGLKGCELMVSDPESPVNAGTESNSTLYTCAPADAVITPLVNPNIAIIKQLGDTSNLNGVNINVLSGAAPRQLTYKGFVNFDYTWSNCESRPYVGLGVEAEGGSRNCDLAQWGLWLRTGVAY